MGLARKGFSEVEGEHTLKTAAVRSPLPARVNYKILYTNLMRRAHVTRQTDGMGLNEHTKTVTHHDFYWSTSNDNYTDAQWIPSLIGNWLCEILLILNIQPSWSGHSL